MSGAEYGQALSEVCGRYRKADTEIVERAVRIQAIWLRTKSQLQFLRQLAPTLSEEHQSIQEETLKILANKLDIANTKLRSYLKRLENNTSSEDKWQVKNSKYALFGKNLDKAIDDLEIWQRPFDQSWYLIMKAAKPQIDVELENQKAQPTHSAIPKAQSLRTALDSTSSTAVPVFLPADGLASLRVSKIPHCSASFGKRGGPSNDVILDRVICPAEGNARIFKTNIRNLARKLSQADPITFGLLICKGVVEQAQDHPPTFTMVFRIPSDFSEPQSLRGWLLRGDTTHSLSDRFKIATQIAKSIGYVHTFGFVHKNVRPETILLFKTAGSSIGSVALVGFGHFRDAEGGTLRSGDESWERNVYRHPRRQGKNPQDDYIMQHDIYSLGVCLLELGLRESFVSYDENSITSSTSAFGSGYRLNSHDPSHIKDRLLSMTRDLLPTRMGTKYAEVVETCLTCLDDGNVDFGNEEDLCDEDGILIGVRYVEKVIMRLNSISV